MKKKILLSLFTFFMMFSSIGCSNSGGTEPVEEGEKITFHYQRKDNTYNKWNLWIWEENRDGASYEFNGQDDFGVTATYLTSTWNDLTSNRLGFIVRKGDWESKDVDEDRFVSLKMLKKDDKDTYHVYLKSGDPTIYIDKDGGTLSEIKYATFTSMTRFACSTNTKIMSYYVNRGGERIIDVKEASGGRRVDVDLPNGTTVDFAQTYTITITNDQGAKLSAEITKNVIFETDDFKNTYDYDGELGALYSPEHTEFKVWSPAAKSITLKIYNTGTPSGLEGGSNDTFLTVDMVRGDKGVYSATVQGDLEGKYYTYLVKNGGHINGIEVVDPYAKSCGVNGLRGMIVDFSKTNPTDWDEVDYLQYDRKELTVYETHVADVTSSTTWTGTEANRKLFKGMYEAGTTYTKDGVTVKTGFDHIKELGVNAVQIIPIFDQANSELNMTFNWGYNPLNYNALEGGYSSNPHDGYARIREFKELVKAYHDEGMEIIMDVVYNHVNGAINSNFDVLMPGYYFRYDSVGKMSNGSGCGNETASEHTMMRKFMIDSVNFWLSEYKLGGFRFDLMGLHDLTTMEEITKQAKEINPYVTIYGEPWTGGSSPLEDGKKAIQINGNNFKGYGAFNDHIRDGLIRGGLSGDKELGWITNDEEYAGDDVINKVLKGIKGENALIPDPDKNVTYVTCHDNYTLYDRIIATGKFTAQENYEDIKKMNLLANAVVFTSQGTAFMLAGEEFLRTKNGSKNSYNLPYEDNEINYALKVKNFDLFENYQKLIALKQDLDGLHLAKAGADALSVQKTSDGSTIFYDLTDTTNGRTYRVYHVNGLGTSATVNLEGYTLFLSTIDGDSKVLSSATTLSKYETLIAYR